MEISKWNQKKDKGMMLKVTKREAIQLIQSLFNQLLSGNPNSGRAEHYAKCGTYVSIGVVESE